MAAQKRENPHERWVHAGRALAERVGFEFVNGCILRDDRCHEAL